MHVLQRTWFQIHIPIHIPPRRGKAPGLAVMECIGVPWMLDLYNPCGNEFLTDFYIFHPRVNENLGTNVEWGENLETRIRDWKKNCVQEKSIRTMCLGHSAWRRKCSTRVCRWRCVHEGQRRLRKKVGTANWREGIFLTLRRRTDGKMKVGYTLWSA